MARVATTVGPRATASWTRSPPVTPPAPCTSSHPPAGAGSARPERLVGSKRRHRERSRCLPGNGGRLGATSAAGATSNSAHVPWWRSGSGWVRTSSSRCENRYVLADRGDDTCGFDAECQRWLSADVPSAYAHDLVPVPTPAARTEITSSSGAGDPGAGAGAGAPRPRMHRCPRPASPPATVCEDPMASARGGPSTRYSPTK